MSTVTTSAKNRFDPDVAVDIRCDLWRQRLPQASQLCRRAASAALAGAGTDQSEEYEISVVLADDSFIRDLNRVWRNQDVPTNVLAFPASDEVVSSTAVRLLGDVVIAFETTEREAGEQEKSLEDHCTHLMIHGVLHLLGYDHQADDEAERMEALEKRILSDLDIENPYDALDRGADE